MTCKTIELLNIMGKKWDATVLEEINEQKEINFDKLLAINTKIYPKTLNKALKDLINSGLIKKELYLNNKIKHSNYSITDKGRELLASFENFKKINCGDSNGNIKKCETCEQGPNGVITIQ